MVCYGIFWSGQLPFDTQMKTALTLKRTCFLNNTTDTLLNVFLAIAVDNLANAQILTEDEENEKLERQRKREENKKKYSQKPPKGKGWGKAGAKLPVVMAINHFVRKRNAHASTVADPNNVWSVSLYHFAFFDYFVVVLDCGIVNFFFVNSRFFLRALNARCGHSSDWLGYLYNLYR